MSDGDGLCPRREIWTRLVSDVDTGTRLEFEVELKIFWQIANLITSDHTFSMLGCAEI